MHCCTKTPQIFQKLQVLNGATLKYIAFISMLIDHFNKAILSNYLDYTSWLSSVSTIFDIIGRLAFPLFAFFIVEGFFKTHARKLYLRNLLLFALLSEVPFDLFTTATLFNFLWNNVLFTLTLCLANIWLIDTVKNRLKDKKLLWFFLSLVFVALTSFIAMALNVDYDYHGILVTYFFYIFYRCRFFATIGGTLALIKEPFSSLGFLLTLFYNGEKGKQYKLFNYLFYPVHLLILGLLRLYLGI